MNEKYSSLVWSVKKQVFKELMSLSDEDFVSQVNHAFITEDHKNEIASTIEDNLHKLLNLAQESKLLPQFESSNADVRQLPPKIESVAANTRGSYPLSYLHANNYVSNRVALIG
jgi:ubiquinone biosynthesis monooxygenase Coq6